MCEGPEAQENMGALGGTAKDLLCVAGAGV